MQVFFFSLHATQSSTLATGVCLASARPPFVSFQGHLRIRVHDRDGSLCSRSSNRAPLACTPLCNPHSILRALHHLQCLALEPLLHNPSAVPGRSFPFPSLPFSLQNTEDECYRHAADVFEGEGPPLKPPDGCNGKNHPASPGH